MPNKIDEDEVSGIDKEILEILTKEKDPITTYRIAKKIDVSWSTANTHLKDLQIEGLVESKEEENKGKKSRVWWVEQDSLDKFLK
ncbi:MAG: winged helix-turn-helix transcriptional regulator [Candidatus Aenigmatarchaeota archaeon]